MTDDEIARLLRSTILPASADRTHRDLWPSVRQRLDERPSWGWLDATLATALVVVLVLFPDWLSLLAYHL
jgi:hypothetical protein